MKKSALIWLIIAIALIIVGCLLFAVVLFTHNFDFKKIGTQTYETNTYEISEEFDKISIDVSTTDISFALAEDGKCKVICKDREKEKHAVSVENGTLNIRVNDTRKWYDYIGIFTENLTVTVYLSEKEYSSLSIQTHTGNIEIPVTIRFAELDITGNTSNITCRAAISNQIKIKTDTGDIKVSNSLPKEVYLSTATGKIDINGLICNRLLVETDTGNINLINVMDVGSVQIETDTGDIKLAYCMVDTLQIETDTGDVKLEQCDADSIDIETDTGNVTGTLLSPKIFVTKTSTGKVQVPNTTTGGTCNIKTSTGNIKITI